MLNYEYYIIFLMIFYLKNFIQINIFIALIKIINLFYYFKSYFIVLFLIYLLIINVIN